MMKNEILLEEIIIQAFANVFKNQDLSYLEALQQLISNLESIDKYIIKDLVESLHKNINFN